MAIVQRLRRFMRRKTTNKSKQTTQSSCGLELPASLWISNIFPYLDRNSQNKLCEASRDVYFATKLLNLQQEWPSGTIRIKKIILAASFSPYGNELAFVTSNSKSVKVYSRRHGYEQELRGHKGQCSDVTYAPSGNFLVSCSRVDGTVRLWRKEGFDDQMGSKSKKNHYVNYRILNTKVFGTLHVCVSPNNEDIASYGDDGKIYVSNPKSGKLIAHTSWRSRLFIDCFNCVDFSTERDSTLAHTLNNQNVRLWNYRTQTKVELEDNDATRMVDYAAYVTSLKFVRMSNGDASEPREYLAVGCRVALVKLWDLRDYLCVLKIHLGTGWSSVNELVFNKEGTQMACTGGGSSLRVFSLVPEGGYIGKIENHKDRIKSLAFSPDGKTLASGSSDRTLKLWNVLQVPDIN
ncbi:WD-40 repeat-containing protein [Nitzschia inconspicua]|uniref:WD-40 repeat-containing protein n=1 Tax=Nitzschia inconspicua TaxID=303405 RepID=A0A9K3L0D5_9STRA|nr:WD-40 repeat-containing protein [Nitzschia inconspicua]